MAPDSNAGQPARLEAHLRDRLAAGAKLFVPYVTAGLFGVDAELLRGLETAGADAIEVGVPFSDPVIDGGVIQEASRRALESGFRPAGAFELVKEAGLSVPVVLMTYLNPVLAKGTDAFIESCVANGVAGTIIPDLPEDEASEWTAACRTAGLATVFLAAPGTSKQRLSEVANASSGFVYCVTTYGVTGSRESLDESAEALVGDLRELSDKPLLVGVGISTPAHAAEASEFADGVIVGSALVKPMLAGDFESALAIARDFRAAIPSR